MRKILTGLFYHIFKSPFYKLTLGSIGKGTKLINTQLTGSNRIFIGSKVYINKLTWLACAPLTGDASCALHIGDGTYIGRFGHFYATSKITIGKKVLIADKVYISDNLHSYENIQLAVIDQPLKQVSQVVIGDGAWLGENVCIIGASIGKNSVIAANSVVNKNIPDYCVAAGTPAVVIKRFNFETNSWQKTDSSAQFI
jgi:acetyltransferase-like isoleucine patch superfamily enzyme